MPQIACEVEAVEQPGNMEDLYNSDDFRMYCLKVLPCSKHYSHDWTVCPFAHPGEKARRRDPRVFKYAGVECPHIKEGVKCPRGDLCPFAHNIFECWLHPTRYRTQLCNEPASCKRKVCFFAHALHELREPCNPVDSMPKGDIGSMALNSSNTLETLSNPMRHSIDYHSLQSIGMVNPMSPAAAAAAATVGVTAPAAVPATEMMLPNLPQANHSNMESLVTALQSLCLQPNSQSGVSGENLVNVLVNLLGEISQSNGTNNNNNSNNVNMAPAASATGVGPSSSTSSPPSLPRASLDNHNLDINLANNAMACINSSVPYHLETEHLMMAFGNAKQQHQQTMSNANGFISGLNGNTGFDQTRHTSIEQMMNTMSNPGVMGRVSVDNALLNGYSMSNQSKMHRDSSIKGNFASISESPLQNSDTESYHSRKSTASDISQAMSYENFKGNNNIVMVGGLGMGPGSSSSSTGTSSGTTGLINVTSSISESFPPTIQSSYITSLSQQQLPIQHQQLSMEQHQQSIQQTSPSDMHYRGSVDSSSLPEPFIMY